MPSTPAPVRPKPRFATPQPATEPTRSSNGLLEQPGFKVPPSSPIFNLDGRLMPDMSPATISTSSRPSTSMRRPPAVRAVSDVSRMVGKTKSSASRAFDTSELSSRFRSLEVSHYSRFPSGASLPHYSRATGVLDTAHRPATPNRYIDLLMNIFLTSHSNSRSSRSSHLLTYSSPLLLLTSPSRPPDYVLFPGGGRPCAPDGNPYAGRLTPSRSSPALTEESA